VIHSTQRQVVLLVAASVLAAHTITFGIVVALRPALPVPHGPAVEALRVVAALYAADPAMRPEVLRQAAAAGVLVRAIPDRELLSCAVAPAGAPCRPDAGQSETSGPPMARATPDTWLAAVRVAPPPRRHLPGTRLAVLVALVGLPTLALSLWASRRITAPLLRLAAQAERVDAETVAAPLPVDGTTEIRLLAEAFNRLILRLTRYAAGQRRMLAAVSHDLRTPLTRLRLRAETVADPALRQLLVRDTDVMQALIDHTLTLQQAEAGGADLQSVDLAALLQAVADDMADAGATVTLGALAPVTARCNVPMLTRALENLIDNASKHAGGGRLSLRAAAGTAIIEVEDAGPGLDDSAKQQAFEPWHRGDAARRGTGNGLGLAIVKTLMSAQGGQVELADTAGRGLLARLVVPVAE
jgi:signal transduction histidine kinase